MPRPGSSPIAPTFTASKVFGVGGLMDRSVTIEAQTCGRDSWGETADTWSPVAGLEDLAGGVGRAGNSAEQRRGTGTITVATHAIVLAGYYPQITTAERAVVDGAEVHDIEAVYHDSRLRVTQLDTRIVS
jgi:hypothetical protein